MSYLPSIGACLAFATATLSPSLAFGQTFTLLTGWPQANGIVHSMALDEADGVLYIGGVFTAVDGQPRTRLAAIDINTGLLTAWAPTADDEVMDIAVSGDSVIIAGRFTTVNGQPRAHIAALAAADGTLSPWDPGASDNVHCVLVQSGIIYIGGHFNSVAGSARIRLAAFDGATGGLHTWAPTTNGDVNCLETSPSGIYFGGGFTQVNSTPRTRLAQVDASTGALTAWSHSADAAVLALRRVDNSMYVGGIFTDIDGFARASFGNVSALSNGMGTMAVDMPPVVRTIAADGDLLAVGGFFGQVVELPHPNLAVLDAANGGSILGGSPSVNSSVNEVILHDGRLYAVGAFTATNSGARDRIAVWSYCTEQEWYADADEDGLGDNGVMLLDCLAPASFVADNTDCDDTDDQIGAALTWYTDADGDEFGDPFSPVVACEQPLGTSEEPFDCDDTDPEIVQGNSCDDNDPFTANDLLQPYPDCGCIGKQVIVDADVLLEGAYDPLTGLMRDDLRAAGLVPLMEPYTGLGFTPASDPVFPSIAGGDVTTPAVLAVTGPDAIVDWIILELRSNNDVDDPIASNTRYVLVQRDGDIVEPDGVSPVRFPIPPTNYRLSVLHRNHMGVIEVWAQGLANYYEDEERDFTSSAFVMYGDAPRAQSGPVMMLRAGDTSFNDEVIYVGASNDRDPILAFLGGSVPTAVVSGVYSTLDVNMDGSVKYVGEGNDRDRILTTIGGSTPYFIRPHVYFNPTY